MVYGTKNTCSLYDKHIINFQMKEVNDDMLGSLYQVTQFSITQQNIMKDLILDVDKGRVHLINC